MSLNIYSKCWREGKICLIIENFSELQRFLGSSKIFDLLSSSTSRELLIPLPGDVIRLPSTSVHRRYIPKGYLWCIFPRATLEFPAEGICPLHMSLSCQGAVSSAVPSTRRCTQRKKRGGIKQFPFHCWEQIMKLYHRKTLVILVPCDTSIK